MGAEQNDGDAENQAKDAGQFREFFCDALRPIRCDAGRSTPSF